jgi:hypothetical protein
MKKHLLKLALLLAALSLACPAPAQINVTAVVEDANGTVYQNGYYDIDLIVPAGGTHKVLYNGSTFQTNFVGNIDSLGNLGGPSGITLLDNNLITTGLTPSGTQWKFTICATHNAPFNGQPCFSTSLTITGVSPQDITTQLQAASALLTTSGNVPATRTISTTLPLTGGGDLSVNRTFAINNFGGDAGAGGTKGTVPAPAAGDAAAGKYLAAGGGWNIPFDIIDASKQPGADICAQTNTAIASATPGKTVFIPPIGDQTCLTTGIVLDRPITLQFSGAASRIIPGAGFTGPILKATKTANSYLDYEGQALGYRVNDLWIQGDPSPEHSPFTPTYPTADGVLVEAADSVYVNSLTVQYLNGYALRLGSAVGPVRESSFTNLRFWDNGDPATGKASLEIYDPPFPQDNSNELYFKNYMVTMMRSTGVQFVSSNGQGPRDIYFIDGHAEGYGTPLFDAWSIPIGRHIIWANGSSGALGGYVPGVSSGYAAFRLGTLSTQVLDASISNYYIENGTGTGIVDAGVGTLHVTDTIINAPGGSLVVGSIPPASLAVTPNASNGFVYTKGLTTSTAPVGDTTKISFASGIGNFNTTGDFTHVGTLGNTGALNNTGTLTNIGDLGVGATPTERFQVGAGDNKLAYFFFNNQSSLPASGFGLKIGNNYEAGPAEVDFWNVASSAYKSFAFRQKLGAGIFSTPLSISPIGVGDLNIVEPTYLAGESLKNGTDFASNWGVGNDFAIGGGVATYTDSVHSGTLTQLAANQNTPAVGSRWYSFQYVVTANTCVGCVVTITTSYALSAYTLDMTVGSGHAIYFKSAVAPTDFVISVTGSSAGGFTLDNFSLKEVLGGDLTVNRNLIADTVNAKTGFQVNGAATNGNCLVGNGTVFGDAACPAGPGTGTVNSGTATHLGYYATTTNAISDMGADFTFDGTHTLSQGASGIFDQSAAPVLTGWKLPSLAGAAPIISANCAFDSTALTFVCGNGASGTHRMTYVLGSAPSAGFAKFDGTTHRLQSATIATSDLPAAARSRSCQISIGDGLNAIGAGTYPIDFQCKNDTGATITVTEIKCATDNSGASTCDVATNAPSSLLTGAITGSTGTWVSGTQSATTTVTSGQWLKATFVSDGTSKLISLDVKGNL